MGLEFIQKKCSCDKNYPLSMSYCNKCKKKLHPSIKENTLPDRKQYMELLEKLNDFSANIPESQLLKNIIAMIKRDFVGNAINEYKNALKEISKIPDYDSIKMILRTQITEYSDALKILNLEVEKAEKIGDQYESLYKEYAKAKSKKKPEIKSKLQEILTDVRSLMAILEQIDQESEYSNTDIISDSIKNTILEEFQ